MEGWQAGHLLRLGQGQGADTGRVLNGLPIGTWPEEQMAWGLVAGKGVDRGQACLLPPAKSQSLLFQGEEAPTTIYGNSRQEEVGLKGSRRPAGAA